MKKRRPSRSLKGMLSQLTGLLPAAMGASILAKALTSKKCGRIRRGYIGESKGFDNVASSIQSHRDIWKSNFQAFGFSKYRQEPMEEFDYDY